MTAWSRPPEPRYPCAAISPAARAPSTAAAHRLRALSLRATSAFDIFPSLEGYNCDLTRTFAAGQASDLQQEAWAHVAGAHDLARRLIRPGVPASAVYQEILNHLEQFKPAKGSFTHHAGHGVGLDAWEFPWLTPGSDQTIEEGDIIACEPGLYGEALRGGIRLEHNYLVEADGITALDTFPLEL
jgi:Xaa-Pro aminopeptidase